MNEAPSTSRVIALKAVNGAPPAAPEDMTRRLEREGWLRQLTIGEPRLSEIVRNYERLGYQVRVEANQESATAGGGCASAAAGSCSSAGAGCASGGCSSASVPVIDLPVIDDAPELRTVFVRKAAWSAH